MVSLEFFGFGLKYGFSKLVLCRSSNLLSSQLKRGILLHIVELSIGVSRAMFMRKVSVEWLLDIVETLV